MDYGASSLQLKSFRRSVISDVKTETAGSNASIVIMYAKRGNGESGINVALGVDCSFIIS